MFVTKKVIRGTCVAMETDFSRVIFSQIKLVSYFLLLFYCFSSKCVNTKSFACVDTMHIDN